MKAVIHRPVVIENMGADPSDWLTLLEAVDKFLKEYTIFSKVVGSTITIQPQKISLDEPEMAEVFTTFYEVGHTYGLTIDADFHNFRIFPETNRFYISIQ